jgi:hypothetical protein
MITARSATRRSERMQRSRPWLIITAALFAAWMGWLGYMVLTVRREAAEGGGEPVVLSRPQFLVASLVVTAAVEGKDRKPDTAKVVEVHWPDNEETRQLVGRTVEVANLAASQGLAGAGTYLLPLQDTADGYRVAPTPPSPGYPPVANQRGDLGPPRIYPSTPHVREQLDQIRARLQGP